MTELTEMTEADLGTAAQSAPWWEWAGVRFGVITAVPPPETGANMAATLEVYRVSEARSPATSFVERVVPLPVELGLTLREPVFHVGEVLILNADGREIPYPGRKPSKWDVECEEFTDLGAALRRAREVCE